MMLPPRSETIAMRARFCVVSLLTSDSRTLRRAPRTSSQVATVA